MNFYVIFLIAISLSMDAFSLALSFGTLSLSRKMNFILSSTVGVFHFFMPVLGTLLGVIFINKLHIEAHFLSAIIFAYIAFVMFKDFREEKTESIKLSIVGILIFALGVSLDSFGVGFALHLSGINLVKSALTFTVVSFCFTFIGLNLGKKLSSLVGVYSVLVGSIIMFILAVINFCQFLFLS